MRKDLQYKAGVYYVIIFYTLFFYKVYNGLLLCQMQPLFLFVRDDIFSYLFIQTHLPQWLLLHPQYYIAFDAAFYLFPLLFLYTVIWQRRALPITAFIMLLINWIYIQCYTLYPTNSITLFTAWLIFPAVFLVKDEKAVLPVVSRSKVLLSVLLFFCWYMENCEWWCFQSIANEWYFT